MPYNSETETFYQAPATVVDSTPDGDTVQEGFDDRLTPAMAGLYADLNLLKADGMISVGIPATTTARGIGRVATSADLVDGATINNGPAFLAAGVHTSVASAAGKVPVADEDGTLDEWVPGKANSDLSNATGNAIGFYFYARDEKNPGTNGGSTSASSWQTRDLNTVKVNNISGASLANNRITLPAGKYRISASAPTHAVLRSRVAVYDYTHSVYLQYGKSADNNADANVDATIECDIVLSSQTVIELRHWTQSSTSLGLGIDNNIAGVPEVYTEIKIWTL